MYLNQLGLGSHAPVFSGSRASVLFPGQLVPSWSVVFSETLVSLNIVFNDLHFTHY
jgi:hypothetical protein